MSGIPSDQSGDVARRHRVRDALLCMQREPWEQGLAAQAMLESGWDDLAILMARDAVIRQAADGRLSVVGDTRTVTDPAAAGEAVIRAAERTGDAWYRQAGERMAGWLLTTPHRTTDGVLHHFVDKPWVWTDSMSMAPPCLAAAGHPREAVTQLEGMRRLLWDPGERLYHHMWDDGERRFTRAAFWGGANGWAVVGVVRVIGLLPERMRAERGRLEEWLGEHVEGFLARMRPDGLFHDVLDDPATHVETNAAQMLAYAIYRGVTLGSLDRAHVDAADRMREAAVAKVDAAGLVQGVSASPTFDRAGTSPEGQAFFLLMESARDVLRGR